MGPPSAAREEVDLQRVSVEFGTVAGWVWLRELCGQDEESVERPDTEAAIALLDRLLVDIPGAVAGPGQAAELSVADRDRLLATVYLEIFGRRVESTVRCRFCDERFDLDFDLGDLLVSLREAPPAPVPVREEGGVFRMPDGRRFRLPRGTDERAAAAAPPAEREAELLRRAMVEGAAADDPEVIAEAMRVAGPLLDLDLDARCPECRQPQEAHFDLQHYLLTRIREERPLRALEVHRLARAYGWSLREILELPRSRRRLYVDLIERETALR